MFYKVTGEARILLQGMIDADVNLETYIYTYLKENREEGKCVLNYLESIGTFDELKYTIAGTVHARLSYKAKTYFEREKEYDEQQKQSQSNSVFVGGSGNIVQTGNNNTATINNGIDYSELSGLIEAVKSSAIDLSDEEKVEVQESLETIEETLKQATPKKSLIKTALTTLSAIKNTVEFSAAVTDLAQFISILS
jgi:hypothetical protein